MSLLELPPELLHWIFDYLDTRTILDSIRPICTELGAIVNTYNKLRLDISSSGIHDLTSIADFIQPNNVISLILADNNATESSRVTLFFSLFQLDQFNQLQSLTLTEMKGTALDLFFQYIIARPLPLKLFSIKLHRGTRTETQKIINLLSSSIVQSGLQNLHLNIFDVQFIIDDAFQPIQNALRHLIIKNCTYRTYHDILYRCVHLRTLVIENCEFEGINQTGLQLFPHNSDSKLTSLTLNRWRLSIDKLKLILPLTPSLFHLKVIVEESRFRDMLDGDCWKEFIQNKLLFLKKFEFSFSYDSDRDTYDSLNSIITPFRTPFWLKDKHWIVICDFILSSSQIVLHTLPLKVSDSDVVIRCDALSSTNRYHLLTGYWLNHREHDSTEQVFENLT
jgi:hypothetical protein